jgi:ATP-dependent DNA helicase RecG
MKSIKYYSKIKTIEDINNLKETHEIECKLAVGQDGKGELPKDFWSTYSAFSNSHGGIVLLGLKENNGKFTIVGIEKPEKIIKELFDTVFLVSPSLDAISLLLKP